MFEFHKTTETTIDENYLDRLFQVLDRIANALEEANDNARVHWFMAGSSNYGSDCSICKEGWNHRNHWNSDYQKTRQK